MTSRPIMRALAARIDVLGEDEVFMRIAEGAKMREVAEWLGCSRGLLYMWIRSGGDDRKAKFDAAREISSHGLVEDGQDILDGTIPTTSADVSLAVARANYRKWLAGQRNKKDYGEPERGPSLQINVQSLHLDALRQHGAVRLPAPVPALEGGEIVDAEVIDAGGE